MGQEHGKRAEVPGEAQPHGRGQASLTGNDLTTLLLQPSIARRQQGVGMRIVYGLGRAVVGGFFLYNGINHFNKTGALEGYAAAKQVENPRLSVQGAGALMSAAGASLLLGVKPKLGALGAFVFLLAAYAKFHDFWNVEDPQQKQTELIQFSKNVALMGALLSYAGDAKSK